MEAVIYRAAYIEEYTEYTQYCTESGRQMQSAVDPARDSVV